MSLGKTLDRWRSARQLRNTRLSRQALQQMNARQQQQMQGGSASAYGQGHQAGYNLGWSQGWDAGYRAAISDVRQGKVVP